MAFAHLAHMMCEGAATTLLEYNHFRTMPGEEPNGRVVDIGVQSPLRTACHQRHPQFRLAVGWKNLCVIIRAGCRNLPWRHVEHGFQPRIGHQMTQGSCNFCTQERQSKTVWIGQNTRQDPPQHTIRPAPLIGLLDIGPRMIHQMHIVHTRGACGHTGQTRQAAINMFDCLFIRSPLVFQHVLNEIDPAARAV